MLEHPHQFRPGPPVALTSAEWASYYNEVKSYGARNSTLRSPEQTETAKFWLMTGPQAYHPIARQLIIARHMKLVDSARFMAAFAVALTDAYIAVFDAKYHYEFWPPITAIRNGDIDNNPATEIDASWQPLDTKPCIQNTLARTVFLSGTAAAVIESYGGLWELHEISLTSSTALGVTHRWSLLDPFTAEVANSRSGPDSTIVRLRASVRSWEAKWGDMLLRTSHPVKAIALYAREARCTIQGCP